MTTTMTAPTPSNLPKSYLPEEDKEALMSEGGMDLVYLAESQEADKFGDAAASWAWLALSELPAHSLMRLKKSRGAQFIREMGFNTTNAEKRYGVDWLDRE